MKKITKYIANNGREFLTENEALKEDELIRRTEIIMKGLNRTPDDVQFKNGYYFIQQDIEKVDIRRRMLLMLMKEFINHKWIDQSLENKNCHPSSSWIQRLLSDYDNQPLLSAWNRIVNIDKLGREWGQPFYAEHPEQSIALKK